MKSPSRITFDGKFCNSKREVIAWLPSEHWGGALYMFMIVNAELFVESNCMKIRSREIVGLIWLIRIPIPFLI